MVRDINLVVALLLLSASYALLIYSWCTWYSSTVYSILYGRKAYKDIGAGGVCDSGSCLYGALLEYIQY